MEAHQSQTELYSSFNACVIRLSQRERSSVNRKMLSVIFWCLLMPAISSALLYFLLRMHWVPASARGLMNWTIIIFPVAYSVYFFSSEVLREAPRALRRGGVVTSLQQFDREAVWREETSEALQRSVVASVDQWEWIAASFRMDLKAMLDRTRYLTVLGGAVFYLIMQGIDLLDPADQKTVSWIRDPVFGMVEVSSTDGSQLFGLALFLTLLYLSGTQTNQALTKYLNCVELLLMRRRQKDSRKAVFADSGSAAQAG